MIEIGITLVPFIVGVFTCIICIISACDNFNEFKKRKMSWIISFAGIVLVILPLVLRNFCWAANPEDIVDYTTSHDIISISSDDNYKMNLSGTTAFSIGYISGSANKQAEYVVFENHDEKGYIRKEYRANKTFVKFDSNDTPHVTVTHMKTVIKSKASFFADDVKDEWNETTIVVPENAHQLKFNVE